MDQHHMYRHAQQHTACTVSNAHDQRMKRIAYVAALLLLTHCRWMRCIFSALGSGGTYDAAIRMSAHVSTRHEHVPHVERATAYMDITHAYTHATHQTICRYNHRSSVVVYDAVPTHEQARAWHIVLISLHTCPMLMHTDSACRGMRDHTTSPRTWM